MKDRIITLIDAQFKTGEPLKPIDRSDLDWMTGILKSYGFEVTNLTFSAPYDYAFLTVAYDYPREFVDRDGCKFIVGPYHPRSKTWKPTKRVMRICLNHSNMRRVGDEEWKNHISLNWILLGDVWSFNIRTPISLDLPTGMKHLYAYADSIQCPGIAKDFESCVSTLADYLKNGKALPIPEKTTK